LQVADRVHKKSQELLKMLSEALLDSKPSNKHASFSRMQSASLSHTQSLPRLETRRPQGRDRQYQPVGLTKYQPLSVESASEKYQPLDLSRKRGPFVPPLRSDFSRLRMGGKRANGKKEAPKDAQDTPRLESQVDRLEEQSKDLMRLLSEALQSDDDSITKTHYFCEQ
jgi:hypothetical protein